MDQTRKPQEVSCRSHNLIWWRWNAGIPQRKFQQRFIQSSTHRFTAHARNVERFARLCDRLEQRLLCGNDVIQLALPFGERTRRIDQLIGVVNACHLNSINKQVVSVGQIFRNAADPYAIETRECSHAAQTLACRRAADKYYLTGFFYVRAQVVSLSGAAAAFRTRSCASRACLSCKTY
jgi:hypothetical protein